MRMPDLCTNADVNSSASASRERVSRAGSVSKRVDIGRDGRCRLRIGGSERLDLEIAMKMAVGMRMRLRSIGTGICRIYYHPAHKNADEVMGVHGSNWCTVCSVGIDVGRGCCGLGPVGISDALAWCVSFQVR